MLALGIGPTQLSYPHHEWEILHGRCLLLLPHCIFCVSSVWQNYHKLELHNHTFLVEPATLIEDH